MHEGGDFAMLGVLDARGHPVKELGVLEIPDSAREMAEVSVHVHGKSVQGVQQPSGHQECICDCRWEVIDVKRAC